MRRSISIFLSFVIMLAIAPHSFAIDQVSPSNEKGNVEAERAELYEYLVAQLSAQDALEYIDHFEYLIDYTIQHKYASENQMSVPNAINEQTRYYAPDGGYVVGEYANYWDRYVEYLNTDDTLGLYKERNSTENIIKSYLVGKGVGFLTNLSGSWGKLLSITALVNEINQEMNWEKIDVGHEGCMINSIYDHFDLKTITVLWPWTDEPYIDLSDSIYYPGETYEVEIR